jgi:signal transduction histidine kinase
MKHRFDKYSSPHNHFTRRPRPLWWPENEPWPPRRRHWRPRRNPFFRRLGCLFGIVNLAGAAVFIAVVILVLDALGIAHISFDQFQPLLPFGGVFLALFIIVFVLAGRNLRHVSMPLDDLLAASNRLAEGDYAARVQESGPPEVRSLAKAFNSMASRLEVSDQQRRAMLADVSHELRTPLTIIQGNLEGVLDGLYPADEARLKSVLEETHILSRLIDDLRTLSMMESGALHLKREATDLVSLVRETAAAFQSQADEADVKMELSLPEGELSLEVDPERIRQVLTNLVANALRYSPRGSSVQVDLTESGQGPERTVILSVEDSGPGIASADLPHVFERFYKSADSRGMGLGLSIAKYIVEAHGGEIKAESSSGRGTRISFSLPL